MELAGSLSTFTAATLHEATPGSLVLPSALRPVFPAARLRGPAYTVSEAPGNNAWLHQAIYRAPPGSVLVAVTGDARYGYWGELMARAARARGIAGLVIEGGVRDVDALEALGFPVFATAVCMRGTTKDCGRSGALERPVVLGGARVSPGDFVVGDRDGVVVLPSAGLAAVPARAAARHGMEEDVRRRLAGGERLLDLVLRGALSEQPTRGATGDVRPTPAADVLERFRRLDTCAVSDALERLGLPPALGGFARWGPPRRVAGRVLTVALERGPSRRSTSHLGTRALESAGPDRLVVVANSDRRDAASWGGLLTLAAQLRGVAGIVVDGALRDADEVDGLDVPVLARSVTPRSARRVFHEVATNVSAQVGGVEVEPGDWAVADGSGVAFVPHGAFDRVLAEAERIVGEEARRGDALRRGQAVGEVLDAGYDGALEVGPE